MVRLLVDLALSSNGSGVSAHEQTDGFAGVIVANQESGTSAREEHAQRMKELNTKRSMKRAPRRGWSLTDYQGDQHQYMPHYHPHYVSQMNRHAPIPENAVLQSSIARPDSPASSTLSSASSTVGPMVQMPLRPKMPPPRRSQSVTDKEPEPNNERRLSVNMNLLELPSELHYALFDFLDPIDGACLGLAHSRLYSIHLRKNGKVPLSSRYSGPNDMEWAWRGAGPLVRRESGDPSASLKALDNLRVKGQVYCRKCGISRCELHRHLKDWMGSEYEYCEIRKTYGRPADESARAYCYMSSPKNPHRCGRHGGKKP
ncbi:uncharacterized protein MAM_05088 [Metarhizium album ARSEF 1941]|uniref:F-box domain-containing protein n=1 Tax=Metarhizium album (strain ARSEF 1941) TaxID=1081103 RepID=A0A0B2WTI8_METAS|nr:uncharacterized protein MAM_05088 [Metarhizium album ARSEF 1941]KHN96979.1 hypothetical protein MAM_05088 [Metarhizium album ARSEF 1941]